MEKQEAFSFDAEKKIQNFKPKVFFLHVNEKSFSEGAMKFVSEGLMRPYLLIFAAFSEEV